MRWEGKRISPQIPGLRLDNRGNMVILGSVTKKARLSSRTLGCLPGVMLELALSLLLDGVFTSEDPAPRSP
jgi:hypothetical protein